MNVVGLPEPFGPPLSRPPSASHLHSSRTSLQDNPRSRHSGAGTPQFRNLAGIQFPLPRGSRGSLSNLSTAAGPQPYSLSRSHSIDQEQGGGLHLLSRDRESFKGSSSTIDQEFTSTPSPSDSAVGDLENVLKEKDSEIVYLRETMEQNEQVIFKVYEEKERSWERELRKIKALYENRMKANQQKASKMEQALMNQTLQVQNEKRKLESELEDVQRQRREQEEETRALESEAVQLRKSLEQREWDTGSGLRERLKGEEDKETAKVRAETAEVRRELELAKAEVASLQEERRGLQKEVIHLHGIIELEQDGCTVQEVAVQKAVIIERDQAVEKLQRNLAEVEAGNVTLREELDRFRKNFEVEKANWLDEKEKVIRYQKQLQLNYVQMYKRNKTLESEVDQLKKSLAESSQKSSTSTKSKLFSKFSKFQSHESQC